MEETTKTTELQLLEKQTDLLENINDTLRMFKIILLITILGWIIVSIINL